MFLSEDVWISFKVSLKFVPTGPINNIPALVPIMAWRRSGDKPLSEPMIVSLLKHICVVRPGWVKIDMRESCWCNATGPSFNAMYIVYSTSVALRWLHMFMMASEITDNSSVCSTVCSGVFVQPFVQVHITDNIKALRHWLLWTGGFPSQRASKEKMFPFHDVIMTNDRFKYSNIFILENYIVFNMDWYIGIGLFVEFYPWYGDHH